MIIMRSLRLWGAAVGMATLLVCLLNLYLGGSFMHRQAPMRPSQENWRGATSTSSLLYSTRRRRSQPLQVGSHDVVTTSPNNDDYLPGNTSRPALHDIVQGYNITGDGSFLLDFAIIGFPKCGTSSLMFHLQRHAEVFVHADEHCEVGFNQQAKLLERLYVDFAAGSHYRRGLKCPMNLENTQLAMRNYQRWFPKTIFLVGVRHPVLWFESFYNFRVHNHFPMPPAQDLVGRCYRQNRGLCTFRANFHLFLGNLGKTNLLSDRNERALLDTSIHRSIDILNFTQTPVFLYEVSQLSDPKYGAQFLLKLRQFLGLQRPLSPMIWFKPGKNHTTAAERAAVDARKIDICDITYDGLRAGLLEQARNASRWIMNYFIDAPGVMVSSRSHVRDILQTWQVDPCFQRRAAREGKGQ